MNPGHAYIAPYAHQLRVLLYDTENEDVLRVFTGLCSVAGVRRPYSSVRELQALGLQQSPPLEASALKLFAERPLNLLRRWFKNLPWEVAFQLEALLRNNLLHSGDLLQDLMKPINAICKQDSKKAGHVLRHFVHWLSFPGRSQTETNLECFERVRREITSNTTMEPPADTFLCHHVTITPTRMLLEGPYVIQSNRVIRKYRGFENNFIRVDFRDEDRLQFRWDREVDGASFLVERVGGMLKNGLELAGRSFEFLAYSSSALREHAVWYMHPFTHTTPNGDQEEVTSESVRNSLGNFRFESKSEDPDRFTGKLIYQPSKYAARLSQAFTATDSSVKISKDQWELVEDLGQHPYEFTDGCGTISPALGNRIWDALCASRPNRREYSIQPSAVSVLV
jgi:RNA-dependent RNA polymerase